MLAIHILNVGHGDSIVLEHRAPQCDPAFAVIDSNAKAGEEPRALLKLRELGAQSLSFVAVTHPHSDHYLGISAIMAEYDGRIDNLYTFPIEKSKGLKKAAVAAKGLLENSDSSTVSNTVREFVRLLAHGNKMSSNWHAETSSGHLIVATGFCGVRFQQILPPGRVKGKFFQEIENGTVNFEATNQNDLSLAFLLEYKGFQFVLGGDGTQSNWLYQDQRWKALDFQLNAAAAKLPHHGSKTDSSKAVLDILYGGTRSGEANIACISADGRTHPDNDVLDDIISRGLKPYCTNLALRCGAAHREKVSAPDCDPELARLLSAIAIEGTERKTQPCQGDITIRVDDQGTLSVDTQFKHPCPYRGDYESLLGGAVH